MPWFRGVNGADGSGTLVRTVCVNALWSFLVLDHPVWPGKGP